MGILNITPDSFSDGGRFVDVDVAVAHAHALCAAGADIIDIGGESTRPGAEEINAEEELERVIPVIEALSGIDVKISIDTRRPDVAKAAVEAGARIWNDVSALTFAKNSPAVAAQLGCKIVLMHMRGTPKTMQAAPRYKDVAAKIMAFLAARVEAALGADVKLENIILDPGIGFGKRLGDNLDLLHNLDGFHKLNLPILMGTSRKNFINMIDKSAVDERLGGSLASALWAASKGADIIRVHDVAQTVQALKVWQAIEERGNG